MPTEKMDLTDLLNERTRQIKNACQSIWNEQCEVHVSDSEWQIIELTAEGRILIADIAKKLYISRQGIHKLIKSLHEKGLIEIEDARNDKKRKCIVLTEEGRHYYKKRCEIKTELVARMESRIGPKDTILLKTILEKDWGILA